ncbi:MAG: hypothetical protein JSW33_15945, partial [bacterium]
MNIKEKLARLDKKTGLNREPEIQKNQDSNHWILEFQHELGAQILQENHSFIILKENIYPLHLHPLYNEIKK